MRPICAALALVMFAGTVSRGDDKPLEGDLKKIQGKWTTSAGPASTPLFFAFEKNRLNITVAAPNGEEITISGEFTIEDSGKPKQLDMLNMRNASGALPKRLAIYEFDGDDKLKIAGGPDEKTRPKEMIEKAEGQGRANTLVFTRVKEEKK